MKYIIDKYPMSFTLILEGMVSTNDMYFYVAYKSRKSGRMSTHAVKTQELKDFQENMYKILPEVMNDSIIQHYKEAISSGMYGLQIYTVVKMPHSNYVSSDASNYIKAYEDCISSVMKKSCATKRNNPLDDKNNLSYYTDKLCSKDDKWHVSTEIKLKVRDYYYRNTISNEDDKHRLLELLPSDMESIIYSYNDITDRVTLVVSSGICPVCGKANCISIVDKYKSVCDNCKTTYIKSDYK